METLYRKVGNRYIPCGVSDIPHQPGIYMVQKTPFGRSSYYVSKISEIPEDLPEYAKLLKNKDLAANAVFRLRHRMSSAMDIVIEVIDILSGRKNES